jgi:hypothetical protein
MDLLWPDMHARIDWRHEPEFLDKELQDLTHSRARGRRHVDKLVSVRLLDGRQTWLLIHIEVQSRGGVTFSRRMYEYHTLLRARYADRPIASLAILTGQRSPQGRRQYGDSAGGKPAVSSVDADFIAPQHGNLSYSERGWGARLEFTFPVVYVEDWRAHMPRLLEMAPRNAFAVVLLAQLEANAMRKGTDSERVARKVEVMRHLLRWGYEKDNVAQLFSVLDAMMSLPENLAEAFVDAFQQSIKENAVAYVTSFERVITKRVREQALREGVEQGVQQGVEQGVQQGLKEGMQKGLQRGMQRGQIKGAAELLSTQLARKFGALPDWAQARLHQADEALLNHWALRILDAQRIEDVFQS